MPRWLPITLFIAALAAAFWRAPMPAPANFDAPPIATRPSLPSEFFSEKITEANGNVGPSTLTRLPDGRLMIAWQESRTEDPADTKIRFQSQDKQGNWNKAKDVASRASVASSKARSGQSAGTSCAAGKTTSAWLIPARAVVSGRAGKVLSVAIMAGGMRSQGAEGAGGGWSAFGMTRRGTRFSSSRRSIRKKIS